MIEKWKDIIGYEGLFQVSNFGRIKSLAKEWTAGNHNSKQRHGDIILKTNKVLGYMHIGLSKNGVRKHHKVHRLVLQAFCGASELEANHINGKKDDNRLVNLEYCTPSENLKHAYSVGLKVGMKGEKNPANKLNNEIVKNIRENKYKLTVPEFAALYGVDRCTIDRVVGCRTWRHV